MHPIQITLRLMENVNISMKCKEVKNEPRLEFNGKRRVFNEW
jgi:hypothetical protein